jgi:two-component system NarL family sensor kinase
VQGARERLVLIREEERRRIRNDLHDGLGPTLSSLQLQLSGVRRLLQSDPTTAETLIDEIKADLKTATAEIRQLVYDLRPPLLDELGLAEALKHTVSQNYNLETAIHLPDSLPHLAAAVEVAVFRIASEAVHNVVKHAEASKCTLSIELDGRQLHLLIVDDGRGLPDDIGYGVGLNSMRERAEELGGSMRIENDQHSGTRLSVQLPIGVLP